LSVVAIIPARYASTRFPGKPLASDTGKPLIQHVYEAVSQAQRVGRVVVATDDERIADAVASFGGESVMTRSDHATGTDRVAEAAQLLMADAMKQAECQWGQGIDLMMGSDPLLGIDTAAPLTVVDPPSLIINVQGDEPEMDPGAIDRLVELMEHQSDVPMGTLACPFASVEQLQNPACVKVVLNQHRQAIYFSRSLIPYPRDLDGHPEVPGNWLLHLGIYAFRPGFLTRLSQTPVCELEEIERLEQLRVLYMGERIAVAVVDRESNGIDTPEQYAAFVERHRRRSATS
jgi:3-deoxy-manno-octulosonate cytidylyltransferase (CMP-KDO synthetase)